MDTMKYIRLMLSNATHDRVARLAEQRGVSTEALAVEILTAATAGSADGGLDRGPVEEADEG